MIDEAFGKEMHKVYTVKNIVECNDCGFCEDFDYCQYQANCEVSFHERYTDDEQHFLHLEYHFDSIWSDEMNFKSLQYIVEKCNLCVDELNIIRKTLKGNWKVKLTDDIVFSCHHEIEVPEAYYWCSDSSNTVNLDRIAECYDDCDECDKYCYSFKNDSPYEHKCDCPNYSRCADVYGTIYDEFGDEEDFDTLWDFRCQCTKINGRKSLMDALGVDSL